MMLYLLLTLLAWRPEEFDDLPPNYTAWDADSAFYHPPLRDQLRKMWEDHFPPFIYSSYPGFTRVYESKVPIISDTTGLPFTATLGDLKYWEAYGDRFYGRIQFAADTNFQRSNVRRWITVYWRPHDEGVSEEHDIANRLYPRGRVFAYPDQLHLAVNKSFKKINPGGIPAYRHKGKWWVSAGCACGAYHFGGSFTTYLVPTPGLDFHITCVNMTFEWDANPWQGYSEEELDTLPDDIRNSWPDNICNLEQAIEQSFMPRKEALLPVIDTHTFLGPPLPAGYSDWKKRFTLCRKKSRLSYFSYLGNFATTKERPLPFYFEGLDTETGFICADSLRGNAFLLLEYDSVPQSVQVYWKPAGELSLDVDSVNSELISLSARPEDYISLDSAGVEELSVNGNRAFHLRSWRYRSLDEESGAMVHSVVAYLIHCQESDFVVVCDNFLYKSAGLTKKGQEEFYPNRIRQLERAVEQSFRPK